MAGRICKICSDSRLVKKAAELIVEGLSDQKIADQLGIPGSAGRMLVNRHRRFHVEAPAKAIADAANKGRAVVEQREQMVAAAQAGDTAAAFLGLDAITQTLRGVTERLERAADAAEKDNQRVTIATLSGQQLRAAEVRAKLGGVGGYAPPKAGPTTQPMFSLNIMFRGGPAEHMEFGGATTTVVDALPSQPRSPLEHLAGLGDSAVPDAVDEEELTDAEV